MYCLLEALLAETETCIGLFHWSQLQIENTQENLSRDTCFVLVIRFSETQPVCYCNLSFTTGNKKLNHFDSRVVKCHGYSFRITRFFFSELKFSIKSYTHSSIRLFDFYRDFYFHSCRVISTALVNYPS